MPSISNVIARGIDRGAAIESRLGMPWRRIVVLRELSAAATPPFITNYTDTIITPNPSITKVSPRLVGLALGSEEQSVIIGINDLQVEMSRAIAPDRLVRVDDVRVRLWVDPALVNGVIQYGDSMKETIMGGAEYRIIHITEDCHCLKLLIRREADRR